MATKIKLIADDAINATHLDSSASPQFTNLTLTGNLTVQGTTTTLDTTNLQVTDKNIVLNYGTGDTSSGVDGAGITIQDAVNSSTDATISWVASSDEFAFSHPASIVNTVGGDTVLNLTGSYGSGNNVAFLGFARVGGAVAGDIRYTDATTDMEIGTSTAHKFSLKTSNTKRLTVDSAGKVGIGIVAPTTALHVSSGDGSAELILQRTGAQASIWGLKPYNADFYIRENGTDRITVKAGGNVGIGTTDPGTKLDIEGGSGGVSVRVKGDVGGGAYYYGYMFDGTNVRGTTQTNIFYSGSAIAASTTVAEYAGLRIDAPNVSASGAVVTNNYAIYSSGTAQKSYFAGKIGIGTSSPSTPLHVYSNTSGVIATISGPNNYNSETGISLAIDRAKISGVLNGSGGTPGASLRFHTMPNSGSLTERMRIDSSGDVLIGQTSQTGYGFAQKLVVGDGDNNDGITIQSGSTHQGNLAFNHSDGTTAHGRISYQHGTNYMQFFTNNTERMRIDSSGTVYIGPNGSTADPRITRHSNGYDYVNSGNNRWLKVGASSGHTNVAFQDGASGITVFETGGTEMMRIDTDYVVPKMNFHFANNNIYAVSTTGDEHSLSNGVMILKQQITVRAGSKIIVWYDSGQILNNNQGGNGSTNSNPQIAIYVSTNSSAPSRGSANMINNNTDHVMYPAGNIGNARAKMHGHGATGTISSGGTYYIYMYGGSYNNGQFTFNYQNSSGNTRGSSIIWAEVKA